MVSYPWRLSVEADLCLNFGFIHLLTSFILSYLYHRGFRQVTKGPDIGSFHHPLFRRDEPNLCLRMNCQSKAQKMQIDPPKRTAALPPKKRLKGVSFPSTTASSSTTQSQDDGSSTTSATCSESSKPSPPASSSSPVVTMSDGSLASKTIASVATSLVQGSAVAAAARQQQAQPNVPRVSLPVAEISLDEDFVAATLRLRDHEERARIAKAMLYESFIKALANTKSNP